MATKSVVSLKKALARPKHTLNLLLKSSLREADGQLVSRMVNRHTYQEDQDQWVPEQVYYEEYGTDEATGSQYVSRTTYYYDNYSLQIN